jgi:hypothetical protein
MSTIETVNFLVLMMTLFMVCLRVSIATTIPGISNLLRSYLIYLMGLPFIGDNTVSVPNNDSKLVTQLD